MTTESYIKCDKCGQSQLTTEAGVFLQVEPRASQKAISAMDLTARELLLKTMDHGDFCSLLCLGEWALARHNLKSFDAEMGGEAQ